MSGDDPIAIRTLDGPRHLRDGSEQRILEILSAAADRSSGSDELAAAITDWPSRYHLSPKRANLLRPLRLGAGLRILEIGAGTGVLSRFLGETGARVVALEGSVDRARAAALRCAGLPHRRGGVRVARELLRPGGLRPRVHRRGARVRRVRGRRSPEPTRTSSRARRRCSGRAAPCWSRSRTRSALKYLLGYREDHLGLPWIGIEGYPGDHGIRTFPRRVLSRMLDAVGAPRADLAVPLPGLQAAGGRAGGRAL